MVSFYLNCASFEEIFPDAIHLKILYYLREPYVYKSFPTISKTYLSIFCNSPSLYTHVTSTSFLVFFCLYAWNVPWRCLDGVSPFLSTDTRAGFTWSHTNGWRALDVFCLDLLPRTLFHLCSLRDEHHETHVIFSLFYSPGAHPRHWFFFEQTKQTQYFCEHWTPGKLRPRNRYFARRKWSNHRPANGYWKINNNPYFQRKMRIPLGDPRGNYRILKRVLNLFILLIFKA